MSRAYKFRNPEGLYFISFATVGWIDVFTRRAYKEILIESIKYCQQNKGLGLYAWCIMSNHVHMIVKAKDGYVLPDIVRDFKKFTSKEIIKAIEENIQESRKEWMLAIFKNARAYNSNNKEYQFWQQHNRPIQIYSPAVISQKVNYIHYNPVEEVIVESPEQYLYSSARNFNEEKGLLDLEVL
jgi:REP element-mobilizing transposase RayT